MESPCSRCGCDRPFHDRISKAMKMNWEVRQQYKRDAARNATEIAERDLQIMELQEGQKWLQQKVVKQASQLRRFEEKIKKLGKEPYGD